MKKNPYAIIVLTILSLIIMVFAFAQPFRLSGNCMEPALRDGKLCFLNRILPYMRNYQRGDIIVHSYTGIITPTRVVALENDMINIDQHGISVNGKTLVKTEIHKSWFYQNPTVNKKIKVPVDHVFILSDNLIAQHKFTRAFGPIAKSSIMGMLW